MTLHLLKLAVGITDIEDLVRVRAARAAARGGDWVYTRNHPRRAAEILAGGSIYWVIRGRIRVRQSVTGFRRARDENGRGYCLIDVDPALVETQTRLCRAFQGWRYLPPEAAPPDRSSGAAPPPERMLAELRALGLI
ncbi:MAG TPA: DUF1489 domain-containing protein [Stellaceae bacterium]|nr:DUF1489 domain-containing protein [Stellaceae bacterium]